MDIPVTHGTQSLIGQSQESSYRLDVRPTKRDGQKALVDIIHLNSDNGSYARQNSALHGRIESLLKIYHYLQRLKTRRRGTVRILSRSLHNIKEWEPN